MSREKIIFIGGITGTGKTKLAIQMAKKLDGELINADSMQIYKYLDIGTNKGEIKTHNNNKFIEDIPVHLVSFLDPNIRFSVFEYKKLAEETIETILLNGKLPIVVGGTGLYIDSIIKNYSQQNFSNDISYRLYLDKLNLDKLQNLLKAQGFNIEGELNISDRNNPRRLIRILEKLKQKVKIKPPSYDIKYDYDFYYPKYEWAELINKIDKRVEKMFNYGIIEETIRVLDLGFSMDCIALQATGYKQVIRYLKKELDLEKCIELVKIAHRQYARRQKTWFENLKRGYNLISILV